MNFKYDGGRITIKGDQRKVNKAQADVVASHSRGDPAVIDGTGLQIVITLDPTAEERLMAQLLQLDRGTCLADCATVLQQRLRDHELAQAERDQARAERDEMKGRWEAEALKAAARLAELDTLKALKADK